MKNHTKVYLEAFYPDWGPDDFLPCEKCGARLVDVHHLDPRGMGGSKLKDRPEILMGLCRKCHLEIENNPKKQKLFEDYHKTFMEWRQ